MTASYKVQSRFGKWVILGYCGRNNNGCKVYMMISEHSTESEARFQMYKLSRIEAAQRRELNAWDAKRSH